MPPLPTTVTTTPTSAMLQVAAATMLQSSAAQSQMAGMTKTGARAPTTTSIDLQARAWVII